MAKIIKITEDQLKTLIDKQITEQNIDSKDDGSYMVLSNLMMIKEYVETILKYKHNPEFVKLVTGEHAWAGDHIATSKDDIQEVANFIEAHFNKEDLNESTEEIDESKNKPTNPKLWAASLAWAKSRYKVCPSAYCNGAAAKRYKSKGGKWKKK